MDVRPRRIRVWIGILGVLLSTTAAAIAKEDFVFVHDRGSPNKVDAFKLAADGVLTPVPGSAFVTSAGSLMEHVCFGNCRTAAYSTKLRVLFVSGTIGLSALRVEPDGSLVEAAGAPFGPPGEYVGVAVVQKGKSTFVYASEVHAAHIRGFRSDTQGVLTELPDSPFAVGTTPVALASAKSKVFAVAATSRELVAFNVNAKGALIELGRESVGTTNCYTVNTDAKGTFAYVPENVGGNEVLGFKLGKKGLGALAGSPFASGVLPDAGLVVGTRFAVALQFSGGGSDDLQGYLRLRNGKLEEASEQSSGLDGVNSGATAGNRLVLASDDGDAVRSYTIGQGGALTVADTEQIEIDFANAVLIVRR